jgi:CHAD domain-containing protein
LRRLWRLASKARNLEVRQATIAALGVGANDATACRATDAARRLTVNVEHARRKLTRAVVDDLPGIAVGLSRHLQVDTGYGNEADNDDGADSLMAASMARLLRAQLTELTQSLDRLPRGTATKRMHALRISAKKLRYLLDVFDSQSRLAATAVSRLARLQDVYGSLRDAQLLDERLAGPGALSLRRDPVRMALRRQIRRDLRRARQVVRSREITTPRQATERLTRQLERRGAARHPVAGRA